MINPTNNDNFFSSFVNSTLKTKKLSNNIRRYDVVGKISEAIDGFSKLIKIYEKSKPIVEQSISTINNINATIKVAKAFRKLSSDQNIEKMLDDLPDTTESIQNNISQKENGEVANPFYP